MGFRDLICQLGRAGRAESDETGHLIATVAVGIAGGVAARQACVAPSNLASVEPPKTLVLTETGVEQSPDGAIAVNVGPIVRALKFVTEGRGDDRGADEQGNPLPDLMSLAFDVVESIIVGGPKADYFRQVKQQLEAQADGAGRSSLALAKHAKRVQPPAEVAALAHASSSLQALLGQLQSTTAELLAAMNALGVAPRAKPRAKAKAKSKALRSRKRAVAKKKTKASLRPPPKQAASRKRKRRPLRK